MFEGGFKGKTHAMFFKSSMKFLDPFNLCGARLFLWSKTHLRFEKEVAGCVKKHHRGGSKVPLLLIIGFLRGGVSKGRGFPNLP